MSTRCICSDCMLHEDRIVICGSLEALCYILRLDLARAMVQEGRIRSVWYV